MKTRNRLAVAVGMAGIFMAASQGSWAAAYFDQVKGNNPVFYWRLGEHSGTAAQDASGHGITGTYVGAVSLGNFGAMTNADFNTSAGFTANTQRVDAADALYTLGDIYTIEAFGMATSWNPADLQYLFGRGSGAAAAYDSVGFTGTGWSPAQKLAWFNGSSLLYGSTTINTGNWYHVVAVRSNTSVKVYLNGALDISGTSTITYGSDDIVVANRPDLGIANFFGRFDEVAVYDYALTPAQVQADYNSRTNPAATSYKTEVLNDAPLFYWRLGESSGTVAQDAGGSNIPGAYVGGVALGQNGALAPVDANKAVGFSANSQRVDVDNSLYALGSNYTLEAFIRATNFYGSGGAIYQYAYGRGSSTAWETCGMMKDGDNLYLMLFWNPSGAIIEGTTPLSTGVWYHVVFLRNNSGIQAYVNGKLETSHTDLAPPYDSDDIILGNRPDLGHGFQGSIDEFAVYNYVLSPARIQAHYDARTRFIPPSNGTIIIVR